MLSKLKLFDSDSLKLLHRRVFFSITIFIFVYFISIYRISSIMLFPDLIDTTNYVKKDIRGSIYDRNGNIIATSIESISLSTNPNKIRNKKTYEEILKRPNITIDIINKHLSQDIKIKKSIEPFIEEAKTEVEAEIKYEGYIERQKKQINKIAKNEHIKIPKEFNYQ